MNDSQSSSRPHRARQRQQRRKQQLMAVRSNETSNQSPPNPLIATSLWLLRQAQQRPLFRILMTTVMGIFLIHILTTAIFRGHIPPNVAILDIPLSGMSFDAAIDELEFSWADTIHIELHDGERRWVVSPTDLGFELDAQASIEAASVINLPGMVIGFSVSPVVTLDVDTARLFLSTLADDVFIPPTSIRYTWNGSELVGMAGQSGTGLDVEATLQTLAESPLDVLMGRQFDLVTVVVMPDTNDPDVYLDDVAYFIEAPFQIVGYDPFLDETLTWTTAPIYLASWFEVGDEGLVTRDEEIDSFVSAINDDLATRDSRHGVAYLDLQETLAAINQSLRSRQTIAHVQVRYQPSTYEVVAGDTGYRISRRMGIPFFLIEAANPNIDLDVLSPGDVINLPSHEVTIPLAPMVNKRIIVDLETQSLVAYEDRQEVFRWRISSGITSAPTSPGIYQILSHDPVAYGSSYTLCDDLGCGQWQMNWFMGIYEVVPGLVNGFHGAVLLPDGTFLGGNNVGTPYTLGCVMSRDDQARLLYDWAEVGTIVEIISDDFPPQSALARQAFGA